MNPVARVALLVALWLLAWGDLSVANLLSGLVVAGFLLVAFPSTHHEGRHFRARPVAVMRLVLHVLVQLVPSSLLVAREILSRKSRVRSGVVAYRVQNPSDEVLNLVANILALTPGTMTVETTRDPAVIYVHCLLLEDIDAARRTIARLEELAQGVLGHKRDLDPTSHELPGGAP